MHIIRTAFIILISLCGKLTGLNSQKVVPIEALPATQRVTLLPVYDLSKHKVIRPTRNNDYGIKISCAPIDPDSTQFYMKVDKVEYEVENDFLLQINPRWISSISIFKEDSTTRVYFDFKKKKKKTISRLINQGKNLN
ncbi:MAG: hypothetical protein Roseis2KO_60520 [Roseivirga sp.]